MNPKLSKRQNGLIETLDSVRKLFTSLEENSLTSVRELRNFKRAMPEELRRNFMALERDLLMTAQLSRRILSSLVSPEVMSTAMLVSPKDETKKKKWPLKQKKWPIVDNNVIYRFAKKKSMDVSKSAPLIE